MAHIEIHAHQDGHLEQGIEVGHVDETTDVEHDGSCVERQHVDILDEGQAVLTEVIAKGLWYVLSVMGFHACHQLLELRGLSFLGSGIWYIGEQEELPDEVVAPLCLLV